MAHIHIKTETLDQSHVKVLDLPIRSSSRDVPTDSHLITKEIAIQMEPPSIYKEEDGEVIPHSQRLLVLVPDQPIDDVLASHLWSLATQTGATSIQLLTLVTTESRQVSASRNLATLADLLRDERYQVQTQVVKATTWMEALTGVPQAGDLIVCPKGQNAHLHPFHNYPLEDALLKLFQLSVYCFSISNTWKSKPGYLQRLIFWTGLLVIFAGFFLAEASIVRSMGDAGNLLLFLLFCLEVFSIWGWNTLQ